MAKKNWFSLLKRIFTSKGKRGKSRRWVFGKPKIRRLAPVSASPPSIGRSQSEGVDEEQEHSLETAEFFQITTSPISIHHCDDENCKVSAVETRIQELAATKIQTAFRGYLARKALRALKGLVRLQAIVRGRAVRRHAIITLKRLQSVVNIQSQVCAKRCQMADRTSYEHKESPVFRGKDIKIDSNSQRRWDDSILTKQEEYALSSSKREAAIKRERIKEYAFNHRMSTETEQNKANGRWRYWLEQWVETRLAKSEDLQDPKNGYSSQSKNNEESGERKPKSTKFQKQYLIQGLNSPLKAPRRSFHRKQHSIGEDGSLTSGPTVPTYMAATESAKARTRSMSSPRLRPVNLDYYSDTNSPYKYKLTPISPINKEVTSSRRSGNPGHGSSQNSPSLRDLLGPVKSNTQLKDLSVDSLFSLSIWDTARR